MNEKHRRMWIRWLEGHCECCGGPVMRAKFIGKRCPNAGCSGAISAINEKNLLEHLSFAWQAGKGPSDRPQGPAWTVMRQVAGEFTALDVERSGIDNLDESLEALLKVLVEVGG